MKKYAVALVITATFSLNSYADNKQPTCENVRFKLTPEQIVKVQNVWGGALDQNREILEEKFTAFQPNDYQSFAQYKVNKWLPAFNSNKEKMDCGWKKYGWPMDPDYDEIKAIHQAMTNLNIISIKMQSYLRRNDSNKKQFIEEQLREIASISKKYTDFKPAR